MTKIVHISMTTEAAARLAASARILGEYDPNLIAVAEQLETVLDARLNPDITGYQQRAKDTLPEDGVVEVDDDPAVSISPEGTGAYVMAWHWFDK